MGGEANLPPDAPDDLRRFSSAHADESSAASGREGPTADDRGTNYLDHMVDEWGRQSFPASDPPSNW